MLASPPISVPKPATADQVRHYVEQGFVAISGLVTPAEIEEMRGDVLAIMRGRYPCDNLTPLPADTPDAEILNSVLCVHQVHYISPTMEHYVKHPKICGALSQLTAAHLPEGFWDGSVKCMQSMFFVKPPQFPGQAWHQDEIYIPTRDRSLVGAWIALDDATIENGCLWVLPGSHRMGYIYPQRDHTNLEEFDGNQESFGFDDTQEVPVEVKTGDVVFFNGYLLHRSRKNRSNINRRVLVSHYMNAWSLLPWVDRAARADVRTIVLVAGVDPYAWKGYEQRPKEVYLRKPPKPASKPIGA